jgi:hypothetical protein
MEKADALGIATSHFSGYGDQSNRWISVLKIHCEETNDPITARSLCPNGEITGDRTGRDRFVGFGGTGRRSALAGSFRPFTGPPSFYGGKIASIREKVE